MLLVATIQVSDDKAASVVRTFRSADSLRAKTATTGSYGPARGSVQSIVEAGEPGIGRAGLSYNLQETSQMNAVVAAQGVPLGKISGVSA